MLGLKEEKCSNNERHDMRQTDKSLDLPNPIAAYFEADKDDSETLSQCFTENAVVKDEGHTYKGRAAIRQWKTDATAKYQYTSEPFACEQKGGKTVVTSRLTGNFPGSPVDLRFFFALEGGKISSLEIIP
jgi:SnoaL-like domain